MADHNINEIIKNIEVLSDKDKISHLFDIIDEEKNKPWDQIDFGKIEACSQYINELTKNDETQLSPERIEFIKAKNDEKARMAQSRQVNRRFPKRLAVAAAAALIICSAAVTVFVAAEGFGSMEEFVSYISLKLKPGERADQNGITFINNGKSINYDSVEEFASKENLDVFYPAELPEGVFIKKIILTGDLNGENDCTLVYVFNNNNISFLITNHLSVNLSMGNYELYDSPFGTFHIKETNGRYQAVCQTEKYEYCIDANDIKSLQIIMKGLQQQ